MKFLRDNLFLICTAAAVLAPSVVLLAMSRSAANRAAEYGELRTAQSSKISSLSSSGINENAVQLAEKRVDLIKQAAGEVEEYFLQRNRDDYELITFEGISGEQAAAFPIDPELYQRHSLRWLFPQEYRKRVLALVASLGPTAPPTKEELDRETELISSRESFSGTRSAVKLPSGSGPPPRPGSLQDPRYARVKPSTGAPGTTAQPGEGEMAEELAPAEKAFRNLVWAKAGQGRVYVTEESMVPALIATDTSAQYSDDDLWMAQVSLWIQKDIVAAINKTNEDARRRPTARQNGGVPDSAVKRLVNVGVFGYFVREGATGSGSSGPTGQPRVPVAGGRFRYVGNLAGSQSHVPRLTERACNPLYDVVHYEFTVILPVQHLRDLLENLRLQNFHTVLDCTITLPQQESGSYRESSAGENRYYYGTDPVVQVEIIGELLLLTDWTRGRWDAQEKRWDPQYPPLMPKAFLLSMSREDPSALRPEDSSRLGTLLSGQLGSPRPRP